MAGKPKQRDQWQIMTEIICDVKRMATNRLSFRLDAPRPLIDLFEFQGARDNDRRDPETEPPMLFFGLYSSTCIDVSKDEFRSRDDRGPKVERRIKKE